MIVYLHGFNSSPASGKAREFQARMAALGRAGDFVAPTLAISPEQAMREVDALIAGTGRKPGLVGSSLGGFYATWLAERHGLRAAVINPAVGAHELLRVCLGTQRNFHTGREYEFTEELLAQLRPMHVPAVTRPERYFLLAQTGDEVLDYRRAVDYYQGARQAVIPGGDHSFQGFADHIDQILAFLDAERN